jgi:GDP-L-fucose synthase
MPTNLYGRGDHSDPHSSHVAAALQVKVHQAQRTGADEIEIWGTGAPRREFLHVDDLADAVVFLMKRYSDDSHVNVGTGSDITIRDLAELLAGIAGWQGRFVYDRTRPAGMDGEGAGRGGLPRGVRVVRRERRRPVRRRAGARIAARST